MIWKTKRTREEFELLDGSVLRLEIEELESLENTIDELFVELEKTGNPSLLEELCPYFGCIWPSARGLTQYLLRSRLEDSGAIRILEVGSGLALPSLALAQTLRLSRVIATDFHPEVPSFLKKNLELNPLSKGKFEYRPLNWKIENSDLGRFSFVIGSDILYEKSHPSDVAEALVRRVKKGGRIIIADPGRPYLQIFLDEMRARGYGASPVVITDREGKDVFIFDFRAL